MPFVFDRMVFRGRVVGALDGAEEVIFTGGAPQIDTSGSGRRRREMPLTLDLVGFE